MNRRDYLQIQHAAVELQFRLIIALHFVFCTRTVPCFEVGEKKSELIIILAVGST
jgi:hypothetical protein